MPRGCTTSVQGEATGAVGFRSSCDLFDRVFVTITHVKNMRDGRRAGRLIGAEGDAQCKKGLHSKVQAFLVYHIRWWEVQVSNLRPLQCECSALPLS